MHLTLRTLTALEAAGRMVQYLTAVAASLGILAEPMDWFNPTRPKSFSSGNLSS